MPIIKELNLKKNYTLRKLRIWLLCKEGEQAVVIIH